MSANNEAPQFSTKNIILSLEAETAKLSMQETFANYYLSPLSLLLSTKDEDGLILPRLGFTTDSCVNTVSYAVFDHMAGPDLYSPNTLDRLLPDQKDEFLMYFLASTQFMRSIYILKALRPTYADKALADIVNAALEPATVGPEWDDISGAVALIMPTENEDIRSLQKGLYASVEQYLDMPFANFQSETRVALIEHLRKLTLNEKAEVASILAQIRGTTKKFGDIVEEMSRVVSNEPQLKTLSDRLIEGLVSNGNSRRLLMYVRQHHRKHTTLLKLITDNP